MYKKEAVYTFEISTFFIGGLCCLADLVLRFMNLPWAASPWMDNLMNYSYFNIYTHSFQYIVLTEKTASSLDYI